MTATSPKVLIVDDEEEWRDRWTRRLLREGAEVLKASSLEEGWRLFEANPDIALVIMDTCVPGFYPPNSMWLVEKMHQTFKGPIIAASGHPDFRRVLMGAGCSHEASKNEVSALISQILKTL